MGALAFSAARNHTPGSLFKDLNERDVDWKRFLINRPAEAFDPHKYLEYRLFWPYSSGIPGQ